MKILVIFFVSISLYAGGVWSMVKNVGLPTAKSKPFQIEVQGTNIRGYTFKPRGVDMVCVNIWGENTQTLECKTFKELGIKEWK